MHLRSLELVNFRRFERLAVELPDGVIGILGPNGAGKSTLVEAIGWALFGHDAARTTKDQVRRQGSEGDVRVALEFALGDHTYRLVREMVGKNLSASAHLTVDGQEVVAGGANSHAEVTDYVSRLLGMDREAFFTSIVAKQNELDALSDMTPGRRKEVLLRMLDVDALDAAIERVRQDRREAAREAETLESTLKDPEALAEERARLAQERRRLDAEAEALDDQEAEATERVEALKAERDALKEAETDHADAKARLAGALERLDDLAKRATRLEAAAKRTRKAQKELDAMGDVEARHAKAKERFEALDARREEAAERRQLVERLEAVRAKRDDLDVEADQGAVLEGELADARDALEEVGEEVRRVEGLLERVRSDMGHLRERRQVLADRLATFEELGPDSPCPTCERPLGEAHPDLVDRTEAEVDEVEAKLRVRRTRAATGEDSLEELGERRAALKEQVAALEERLGAWRDRRARAATLGREADDLRERLDEVGEVDFDAEAHAEAKTALEAAEQARQRAVALGERAGQLDEVEAERAEVSDERARLEGVVEETGAEVERLKPRAKRYRRAVEAHDEAQQALLKVQKAKAELSGQRARLSAERDRLEQEEERQDEVRKRVRDLHERERYLLKLAGTRDSGLLLDFRRHLIARVRPALAETASALFTELTDGRYTDLDLDEEYNLLIHDEGEAFTQDRFSGGEVDLANLCLRLAVGRLIAERGGQEGLDIIVLDEVFGSQDRGRRANILRTMQELTGQFRQILVITHIEEVKDRLEHILTVEERDGTSVASWAG